MAVQIAGDVVRAAQAADAEPKIQLVLMAFGSVVPDLDYGAMARTVRTRLAAGATLWDATEQWAAVRTEACATLRQMQAEGYEETTAELPMGPVFLAGALLVWLMVRRRPKRWTPWT